MFSRFSFVRHGSGSAPGLASLQRRAAFGGAHAFVGRRNPPQERCASTVPRGAVGCAGAVSRAGIGPFVLAFADADRYQSTFSDCDINNADANGDGRVDNFAIGAFRKLLGYR